MGNHVRLNSWCWRFISVFNQPPRSTQPGYPFMGRHNEYQPKGGDILWLGSKGRYGLCVGDRQKMRAGCFLTGISGSNAYLYCIVWYLWLWLKIHNRYELLDTGNCIHNTCDHGMTQPQSVSCKPNGQSSSQLWAKQQFQFHKFMTNHRHLLFVL